jgi:hypothetical protein
VLLAEEFTLKILAVSSKTFRASSHLFSKTPMTIYMTIVLALVVYSSEMCYVVLRQEMGHKFLSLKVNIRA